MVTQCLKLYRFKKSVNELPLYLSRIQCGFPSPADEHLESIISLDDACNTHVSSTFLGRATGDSLKDVWIYQDDIMVIDKSIRPQDRDLIVCVIDGEFTAKILRKDSTSFMLIAANPDYEPIIIGEFQSFLVWGVVTHIIQDIKNRSHAVWNI